MFSLTIHMETCNFLTFFRTLVNMVVLLYFCFYFPEYQEHEKLQWTAEMGHGLEMAGKWSSEEEDEANFSICPVTIPNLSVNW